MTSTKTRELTLFALTWPIFIESGLQMFMRIADTFMLSQVSDDAVAAVGVANQIIQMAMLVFAFVSIGSAVVVSQYLGARRESELGRLAGSSVGVNFLFGAALSALVVSLSGPLLHIFGLDPTLFHLAQRYLYVAGGALFIQAVLTALVAIIQSYGYTRQTMMVALGMNVLNVIGNCFFIYGLLGVPKLGVTGVAISTATSQCIGLVVYFILLRKVSGAPVLWRYFVRWRKEHVKKVLRIGIPSSAVTLSYSASQFVILAFIATLGAQMMTTKVYTQNIMFIVMILAQSLGRGGQILVGRKIGAGQRELAYREVFANLRRSLLITLAGVCVLCLVRIPLLQLFTRDHEIVSLGATLLLLSFLLEPGRNFNVILEKSLQAAGDAKYPMTVSIAVTWLFSLPLTYLLGIRLEYGLLGMWSAFIVDEWLRGIILFFRWKSRKWENKSLVRRRDEAETRAAL
ncbi:MATE family efflux transporter [Cohnella nanjingensis]|uniref:MATE family efflux transporter n=1 Tax=Cohnella nanjingensis TaxID=1387779 RepID=A0A7X0VHC6_9BACL|nr:MATE family efflux transporter [Cohnella nanjingensis]MBB6673751.1 MATE family efflux transporter [Cohnella nanjingensis]